MPKIDLPTVFPTGPLNLNTDGSEITYKKSHTGPNATHWKNADAEEMERLFVVFSVRSQQIRSSLT
jgi:hypothetical protein